MFQAVSRPVRVVIFNALILVGLSAALFAQAAKSKSAEKGTSTNGAVIHVMGLEGVKRSAKGDLTIADGKLQFKTVSSQSDVSISSIQDIFTGEESRQVGGTPLTIVKIAAPFGSGRALSLFAHQKVDNLTVEYSDENGGLHDAIFTMAHGHAVELKKSLVEQGAHASIPVLKTEPVPDAAKEKK